MKNKHLFFSSLSLLSLSLFLSLSQTHTHSHTHTHKAHTQSTHKAHTKHTKHTHKAHKHTKHTKHMHTQAQQKPKCCLPCWMSLQRVQVLRACLASGASSNMDQESIAANSYGATSFGRVQLFENMSKPFLSLTSLSC